MKSSFKSFNTQMVLASALCLGPALIPANAPLVAPLGAPAFGQPIVPPAPNLEEGLKKARVNGKYNMLLAQFEAPADRATYGEFADKGFSNDTEHARVTNLPPGYWVYVAPYWYIWRDQSKASRNWGPEQLLGEPNTREVGDVPTSWASKTQDGADEWLLLEYATPVLATGVKIYETYNPGAVNKITAFGLDGKEETIWAGQDNPVENAIFVNQKPFPRPFKTNRVKVYIDSKNVPGWNEIDAVGLTDKEGKTQWATAVECSSTYADPVATPLEIRPRGPIPLAPNADPNQMIERLRQLQEDVNELRNKAGLPPRPVTPIAPPVDAPGVGGADGDLILEFRDALKLEEAARAAEAAEQAAKAAAVDKAGVAEQARRAR